MKTTHYTAVTIGPILRTLQSVRSTKAFWTASYTISYINREFIKVLIDEKLAERTDFIIPYVVGLNLEEYGEYSLYPDRILLRKGISQEKMSTVKNTVLERLAAKVAKDLGQEKEEVFQFCKAYFRIQIVSPVELNEKDTEGNTTNALFELYGLLDTAELHSKTNPLSDNNPLLKFFEKVPGFERSTSYNCFHQQAFSDENRHFPSTAEIATAELEGDKGYDMLRALLNHKPWETENEKRQEEFYAGIRKLQGKKFRNYLKYMAIVQADGDNFSKIIKSIYENDPSKIKDFSKTVFEFTREAAEKVRTELNGYPVYAGGDDLLFFAPVAHTTFEEKDGKTVAKSVKTIFNVITTIDQLFNDKFRNGPLKDVLSNTLEPASMSYGISVGYYKHPLGELQDSAVNQLFVVAKQTKQKNAISMQVMKHSGYGFQTTFFKPNVRNKDSGKTYRAFLNLLDTAGTTDQFLSGVSHKLLEQEATIRNIGLEPDEDERNSQFEQFFIQNFNEVVHTEKDKHGETILVQFLQKLLALHQTIYAEYPPKNEKENADNQNHIKTILEFITFIHNKEENV